jgi:hypothetical protein
VGYLLQRSTAAQPLGNYYVHLPEDGGGGAPYTYPIFEVSNLVRVLSNVVSISAAELGYVYVGIVTGTDPIPTVNSIPVAIPGGTALTGAAGEVGAISAGSIIGSVVTAGSINTITAGSIGWQGSGAIGAPGIFSTALIGPTTVRGDLRGVMESTVGQVGLTISGGSLKNAVVSDFNRFDFTEARALTSASTASATPVTLPQLDLASISVQGTGGILGSFIGGEHIGTIGVSDSGYGIFDSTFQTLGDGTIQGISAGGYGVRFIRINGGASVGVVNARGNGTNLPIGNFPTDVRQSETGAIFDSVTGLPITFINDLDSYLGTTLATQQVVGSTESGVIENTVIVGSRDLGNLDAWSIRGRVVNTVNTLLLGASGLTTVNMANSVANLNVAGAINGLTITTGRTTKYHIGGDIDNFSLIVSGPIGNLVFNSSLGGTSMVAAQGPSGHIQSIVIHGNFSGTISATKTIGSITITGSMIGSIKAASVNSIKLTGGMGNGALAVTGNVGTFETTGDLGTPGNTVSFNGSVKNIKVGHDLNTNISVAANLTNLIVADSILSASNVKVTGVISLLQVGKDIQAGATIMAHLIKKKVIGGEVLGTITTG